MEPTREELIERLTEFLIDAEDTAWSGFGIIGDDDATWRQRLAGEIPKWAELIGRGRATLSACGISVPTPIEFRNERAAQIERERQQAAEERKRRLDEKRCKSCGRAHGHNRRCPNRKK